MLSVIDSMNVAKGFVRPMREGEQLIKSGMVISVGKKGKEGDLVHVQALVLRTSGLSSKDPAVVELWIDLNKEYGDRVIRDNEEEVLKHCNCPAGNSEKCKHIMAVMLSLTRIEEEDLEDLSCTDIERQWGSLKKSTLKEYEAKALCDLCHVEGKRDVYVNKIPQITEDMKEKWRSKLMNCAILSEYSLFMSYLRRGQGLASCPEDEASLCAEKGVLLQKLLSFRSWMVLGRIVEMTQKKLDELEPELRAFYDSHVDVSLTQSVIIASAQQGTPEWHRSRKFRLTSSKARSQYTYYVNPKANWESRYQELFHSHFKGNEDTYRGLVDEVTCRGKYEEDSGCKVLESGLLVRPEVPWLSASLDGTVMDSDNQFLRNIEVKSCKEGLRLTAPELIEMNAVPTLDENGNIKKSNQHYSQMQLGMLISGMSECDYCLFSRKSSDYVFVRVSFDPAHVHELCSRLVHVYFDKFLPQIMADHQ